MKEKKLSTNVPPVLDNKPMYLCMVIIYLELACMYVSVNYVVGTPSLKLDL